MRLRTLLRDIIMGRPSKAHYKFVLKDWRPLFDLAASAELLETKRFYQNLAPLRLDGPDPGDKPILVFAPHPDDDVLGAGGTLIKAAAAGRRIEVVYVSTPADDAAHAEAVKRETLEVCRQLGANARFLDAPAGRIPLDEAFLDRIRALFREIDPGVVMTTFLLDDHDDHRRVNHLLYSALGASPPAAEVWAFQVYSSVIPNVVVDITDQAARKAELIGMWKSVRGNRDWAHYMLGINAANCRYIQGRSRIYAEAFFVLPLAAYFDLCRAYFGNPAEKVYGAPAYRLAAGPQASSSPR
ncbi:GlcNAc-PI de-N-acetylase [anaerobic digester metagenome]